MTTKRQPITIRERLAVVEKLLDHIINNDLKHLKWTVRAILFFLLQVAVGVAVLLFRT